jgi:hypothetical protein
VRGPLTTPGKHRTGTGQVRRPGSDASIDRDDIVERLERASDPKAEERGIRIDRPHEYGAHSNGAASERYRCAITPKPVRVPTGSGVRWL